MKYVNYKVHTNDDEVHSFTCEKFLHDTDYMLVAQHMEDLGYTSEEIDHLVIDEGYEDERTGDMMTDLGMSERDFM